jgi:hypothetical protein
MNDGEKSGTKCRSLEKLSFGALFPWLIPNSITNKVLLISSAIQKAMHYQFQFSVYISRSLHVTVT